MNDRDTIAAIATGMSNSGIGIVRISGKDAIDIADKVFCAKNGKKLVSSKSHTAHYGHIADGDTIIDEALVLVMKAPHTYTAENVVEIDCHGGSYVMSRVLDLVIRNGARPAEPGEFTKRAFLNGKMDLAQAESVIDVINAGNNYALRNSVNTLNGKLSAVIKSMREELIYNIAYIEAALDDPEHISLDGFSDKLTVIIDKLSDEVDELIKTVDNGKIVTEGVRTVILGKPNAGKSSLLNTLVGEERAIVTDIAGTTRDTLEEQINLNGITLKLIDTAGIRQTEDIVEKLGVDKARRYAREADLIIYVVDASTRLDENDEEILSIIKNDLNHNKDNNEGFENNNNDNVDNGYNRNNENSRSNVIVLLNKSDLDVVTTDADIRQYMECPIITVSVKKRTGMDELENTIVDMFLKGNINYNDEIMITKARHKDALYQAKEGLSNVKESIMTGMPEDLYTIDMMNAYEELGKIIGESVGDDLVNEIFSKFCMGK